MSDCLLRAAVHGRASSKLPKAQHELRSKKHHWNGPLSIPCDPQLVASLVGEGGKARQALFRATTGLGDEESNATSKRTGLKPVKV